MLRIVVGSWKEKLRKSVIVMKLTQVLTTVHMSFITEFRNVNVCFEEKKSHFNKYSGVFPYFPASL